MHAVGEISEAVAGGNTSAVTAEEAFAGPAQETIVLVFGVPPGNRVLVEAKPFGGVAAGSEQLAIVEAVIAQSAAQLNPKQSAFGGHGDPGLASNDCNGQCHEGPIALSPALAHAAPRCRDFAPAIERDLTQRNVASEGAIKFFKCWPGAM
jgi:hypothetical protein